MRNATSSISSTTDPAVAPEQGWHAAEVEVVLAAVNGSADGLTQQEAAERLAVFGPNALPGAPPRSALLRFLLQFHNLLIYVLLAAGVLSAAIGHVTDAAVIFGVVLINAVIGFVQEGRAEKALDAIQKMIEPHAAVLRDGRRTTIPADQVVPGDIVLLEAGDRVPADLRIVRGRNLRIDEAILTGESVPVDKGSAAVAVDAALGDRSSMTFSGTLVTEGQGSGVVVATGARTELGRISAMIGAVEKLATPLVRQMDQFARQITFVVLAVSVLVFAYAVLVQAYRLDDAFMIVIGLAVSAIPEGLPAVMTITLAVGLQRMARRNAIIRRLPAVETLGSVSVICSDKTGTLTRNEMTVRNVVTAHGRIDVDGAGYAPDGGFQIRGAEPVDPAADAVLEQLTLGALLCNNAELRKADDGWSVDGDPMEGALITLALKAGHDSSAARLEFPRLDELPFDARTRYMATLHAGERGGAVAYVKGAPEVVLAMCDTVATSDGVQPLDRDAFEAAVETMAANGQRVLAIARCDCDGALRDLLPEHVESGLTLLGLVGLIDPPRPEAIDAVAECRAAGIRVKMITGDHAATARAIAQQLGLADDPATVTGRQLDDAAPDEFRRQAREAAVFARTSPEHKLRLIEALQDDGSVIAMTGDGVNDAPALKRADVGVAMGCKGTEAAKQASEMVLADDNFASIAAAVREGRTVNDNLVKVIGWTLPTNGGEALTIILAIAFGLTLPVTAVQILWINMITAVALGLTLAFEPTEPNAMRRPARPGNQPLLSPLLLWRIGFVSVLMVIGTFGIYAWATARGLPVETARTMAVNVLVVMEIFYLFSVRYIRGPSITWQGVVGTPAVLIGVSIVVLAQLAFTYLPPLQAVFDTRPIAPADGVVIVAVGVALLVLVELEKRWSSRG
ncbi:potassium/sodium efflux P-type ATPase [Rhodopseudomonas thermotolerans]|uniref:Potassium/sodium efflux P-type ATPase n=2 Tax=Rhodopseudomonas TaxID=1073 RepID=A0A336K538_9BRAD|nr:MULTISPECIES: cation-transporting P-type ATPase [Rhodopseudomonas]RED24477.1 potassium/sodium efflux P-type ATPase [Rhodopseudomonas pentothenatexigens]REF90362.1 potassium/sodium efflux P-type ATPase [Rhodopseudomonas thermotolerans]SSW93221.1 potassium/sodium efflux P-type ATPase [Rhodopseudomonas pentothenatexigens]